MMMTNAKPGDAPSPLAPPQSPPPGTSNGIALPPDCPPSTAQPYNGTIYRLVKSDPATNDDFRTHFVLFPGRKWKQHELCPAHGLSVGLTAQAAAAQASRFGRRFKAATWYVAAAALDGSAGPIEQTFNPAHHTWWPRTGFNFAAAFTVQQKLSL